MWLQAGAGNGVKCSTRGSLASTKVLQREEREEEFVWLVGVGAY